MLYWGTDCISLSLRWWREKITHDRQTDMLESKISFNESVLALDLALPVVPRLALHQHSYLGKLAKLIFGKSWEFGPRRRGGEVLPNPNFYKSLFLWHI